MFSQIANDIQFEDTSQTKKEKRKSLLNNMVDDNIDKNLLHELVGNVDTAQVVERVEVSRLYSVDKVEGVLKNSIISNEIDSPVSPKSVDINTTTTINTDENIIFNVFPKIEDISIEMEENVDTAQVAKRVEVFRLYSVDEVEGVEPITEPITEPINVTKEEEDDDMSTLTIESSTNNTCEIVDQQVVIEPVKKKRAYKSRKKA